MPRMRETPTVNQGDQTWLLSSHALENARSESLDVASFAAGDYPDGYIKSGTPVGKVGTQVVKYNSAGTGGAQIFQGFLVEDYVVPTNGLTATATGEDLNVAVLWHGEVRLSRLPVAGFVIPTGANNNSAIIGV